MLIVTACSSLGDLGGADASASDSAAVESGNSSAANAPSEAAAAAGAFPVDASVDYQLGGAYDPPPGVGIVARDSTAEPAAGAWSICYVNGFQTQPGEAERWGGSNADLVLRDASGAAIIDPRWPDEMLLDTSTADKRTRIAAIVGEDIARCAHKGFQGVEIDNLDTFTRNEDLTESGNVALAGLYADRIHQLGLLIGQKNSAEYAPRLRAEVGFDFAVSEECISFGECAAYTDAYGEAVIDIEYSDDDSVTIESVCADASRPASTVIRDRNLVTPSNPHYVYQRC